MDSTVIMHYMYIFERVPVFCIFFPFQFYLDVIGSAVKNPPPRDTVSIPGWGRPPGEGNGNPPQYSCLENRMDRGVWWVIVHAVTRESVTTEWLNNNWHTAGYLTNILRRHSRVTTGISAFPLGWPWEAQSSPRVARESWGWRSSHCRA